MRVWIVVLIAGLSLSAPMGCSGVGDSPPDERTAEADAKVRQKYGKGLAELPVRTLVVISAHNENIEREFGRAFNLHHAVTCGQRVDVEWRDVGGGGSSIRRFLEKSYRDRPEQGGCGIDVLWGGGHYMFMGLARKGYLEPMDVGPDVLSQVPATFGGVPMYDEQRRWFGTALSGFGFVYNAEMLERFGIDPPATWSDLGERRFAGLIVLADPTQSGSAAAAYQMIAESADTWPEGWARLLRILANAKQFTDSAGAAANAPLLGESLVAGCIDFYGLLRMTEAPGAMVYVSPPGETAFTADPIAILRNPPGRRMAQRFVDFVLSLAGQAILPLPPGHADGPARAAIARQPIRRDIYRDYAGQFLPRIVDPYQAGQAMEITPDKQAIQFGVLQQLVRAAAIENAAGLHAARDRLIATDYAPGRLAEFTALPANVATIEAMKETAAKLQDPRQAERIVTEWQRYFRETYGKVAR